MSGDVPFSSQGQRNAFDLCLRTPRGEVIRDDKKTAVTSIHEATELYGFKRGDHVPHRELVNIYMDVSKAMERELARLSSSGEYDSACHLRDNLHFLKLQFEQTQRESVKKEQVHQARKFQRAQGIVHKNTESREAEKIVTTDAICQQEEEELQKTHAYQKEKLEKALRRLPEPTLKPTPLLLELKNSEANLAAQKFYEEAKAVYRKREALERQEIAMAKEEFELLKEKRRQRLVTKQEDEVKQLTERLKNDKLKARRDFSRESDRMRQTVSNLNKDMHHAHKVKLHIPPEYTVNRVFSERVHSRDTSSLYMGDRLLSMVDTGSTSVMSLCSVTDAEREIPEGAVLYR